MAHLAITMMDSLFAVRKKTTIRNWALELLLDDAILTKLFMLEQRQQMTKEEKMEEIRRLCLGIMQVWSQKSSYNDPYEDGRIVGRSTLAETILEIINNG
jgi:hypothetical protein